MRHADSSYPASFKAAVALAALRRDQPLEGLAERFGIPLSLIQQWADVLEQHAEVAFLEASQASASDSDFFNSSELARTIAENFTQGFTMMDRNGFCIYANKAWLEMTGYSAQEISSKPLHYLCPSPTPGWNPVSNGRVPD